tara:strand:+ start:152 stop:484 length:333 start_codon:yes stop_codon:yes gene_type:complete
MKIKLSELRKLIREEKAKVLNEAYTLKGASVSELLDFILMWQKELTSKQKNLFMQLANGSLNHEALGNRERHSLEAMWNVMYGQVKEIDDLFSIWLDSDDDIDELWALTG